jgi:alpha,alpha-trehalase
MDGTLETRSSQPSAGAALILRRDVSVRIASRGLSFLLLFSLLIAGQNPPASQSPRLQAIAPQSSPAGESDILNYIHSAWNTLQRSTSECASVVDPKAGAEARVMYVPRLAVLPPEVENLGKECQVRVERLPEPIAHLGAIMPGQLPMPGLLFLPNPYVVPGGRFNEMYGWDSYFIIRGLFEDGRRELARGMIENFFYEIENYGAVLNANRTYYLTRSQPPFLTSMVMAQYAADQAAGQADKHWLARAYEYSKRDYALWTHDPKLAARTGLSRYFDVGEGPVPEIADHPEYYADVADWLVRHPQAHAGYLARTPADGIGPELRVPLCDGSEPGHADSPAPGALKPCANSRPVRFTADYYKGDRAMRESGFDISFRFGPFSGSTHHYAPVCLNSLLYKAETDLAKMAQLLGYSGEARSWRAKARYRKKLVNRYLWNSTKGMFFDYDLAAHEQSTYNYATTFYPLWVGLATRNQAKAVLRSLAIFEQQGGIAISDRVTGVQWDKPYGWAPVEMIAVEGMRRYGFSATADRISKEFLRTIVENYRREGTIREKYNVVTRSTEANVTAGYQANVVGFGWTNGAFLVLLHTLPQKDQRSILMGDGPVSPTTQ